MSGDGLAQIAGEQRHFQRAWLVQRPHRNVDRLGDQLARIGKADRATFQPDRRGAERARQVQPTRPRRQPGAAPIAFQDRALTAGTQHQPAFGQRQIAHFQPVKADRGALPPHRQAVALAPVALHWHVEPAHFAARQGPRNQRAAGKADLPSRQLHQPQIGQSDRGAAGAVFGKRKPRSHPAALALRHTRHLRQSRAAGHKPPRKARTAAHAQRNGNLAQPQQPRAGTAAQFGKGQRQLCDPAILAQHIVGLQRRSALFPRQCRPQLFRQRHQQRPLAGSFQSSQRIYQSLAAPQIAASDFALTIEARELVFTAQSAF